MTPDQFKQLVIDHLGNRYSFALERGLEIAPDGAYEWDTGPETFYYGPGGWDYSNPDATGTGQTLQEAISNANNSPQMWRTYV